METISEKLTVYDKENKVVFIGNRMQVCKFLNLDYTRVANCINQGLLAHRKYKIVKERNIKEEYEEVKTLLKRFGNTNIKRDVKKIIEMLKEDGIEVIVEHYKPCKQRSITGVGHEKFEEDWILTLKEG